jgi:polyadenylate-binding protein 2
MKQRVEEMEREAKKLRELQAAAAESNNVEGGEGAAGEPMETDEDKSAADSRSVFVGNVGMVNFNGLVFVNANASAYVYCQVDYGATPEEIQGHFQACGTINRVTILCDKFTGHPKGWDSFHICGHTEILTPIYVALVLRMLSLQNQNI